ncbi:MAG: phospholipase [Rhodobacteraceae bacterium]|nr:MAG: phospholipase [Paracoccaceae bacterium]
MTLRAEKHAASSGRAESVVVFVHGYGADGNDLIDLAGPLSRALPNTAFYSPHAPHACTINPMGREWFPIPMIDMSSERLANETMLRTAALFDDWLNGVMVAEGVLPEKVALVGFSQGTMLSLQVAPRRTDQIAAVVGFSGRLLKPETLLDEVQTKPPVLLIHGDIDMVVPPSDMPKAATGLEAVGIDVQTHVSRGMAHGIAPDGLELAAKFLKKHL